LHISFYDLYCSFSYVADSPIIKIKPNNITVNETDDFLIFCDYEANPATLLKVTW